MLTLPTGPFATSAPSPEGLQQRELPLRPLLLVAQDRGGPPEGRREPAAPPPPAARPGRSGARPLQPGPQRLLPGPQPVQERQYGDELQQLRGPLRGPPARPTTSSPSASTPSGTAPTAAAARRPNQSSSTRTPLTVNSQAPAGTGEIRPSPMTRASASASYTIPVGRAGSAARTYGLRPPGSRGRSPPRAPRSCSRTSSRPSSTPAAHTSASAGSGIRQPDGEGRAAARIQASTDPGAS
ncbi:hypothetical protein SCYAM73S_00887 [Streptomyces cyaneofuscatus]